MRDDDGYQLGTPVVPGSDNWTIEVPACCGNALGYTELVVSDSGFSFTDGKRTDAICIYAGARIKLLSRSSADLYITATQAIFRFSSAIIPAGQSLTCPTAPVSIVQGGVLTVRRGQNNPSPAAVLDVTLCPTKLDPDPF